MWLKFFNLTSLWFSHMPIPQLCLLRCPGTGTGQSSAQNMASSILSPESFEQANHKNAYCVLLPPSPGSFLKGSKFFFSKGLLMWEGTALHFILWPGFTLAMVMRHPARDSLPSFHVWFLGHYLKAYRQANVGYVKGQFKPSWWNRPTIQ